MDESPPVVPVDIVPISRQQSRELDRRAAEEYGLAGIILMENAGCGVADMLTALRLPQPFVVCCGHGNNGGDGFVAARHLDLRGFEVRVVLIGDVARLANDARVNYRVLEKSGVPIGFGLDDLSTMLAGAGCVVEGLLGTGATGKPRSPILEAIDLINAQSAPVVAIDLPSGLDGDTGEPAGHTIVAAHTCTFVSYKPGFLDPRAKKYTGQIWIAYIGAPRKLVEEILGTPANSDR